MVAVTYKVVSLCTNTLSESVFALLKTFLELLFCGPSKWSAVLGIAKSRMRLNLANMVDGPISLSTFWPKTPNSQVCHEQGHCHDARSKHQAKVQVFSDKQHHITLPIFPNHNAGSLFDLVKETQGE
jgi:hypothetical protein